MLEFLKYNVNDIVFVGDLHGNFNAINYNINNHNIENSLIIFCGDIGFGFEKPTHYPPILKQVEKLCKEKNNHIVFIRGNHDDKTFFDGKTIKTDHIIAVNDYTILEVTMNDEKTHNILCIGGGISIDRKYRQENERKMFNHLRKYMSETEAMAKVRKLYWKDEINVYDSEALKQITSNKINIDIICTHTCPSFCGIKDKDGISYWVMFDDNLENDLDEERNVMNKVYDYFLSYGNQIKYWYYGHFHSHMEETNNGTLFTMLDMERYGNFDIIKFSENKNF